MRKVIITVLIGFALFACASKGPKKVDSAGNLYVDGVNLMQAKKYDQAIQKFSAIRENHPFDPLAVVAGVKLGDVYFARREYTLAAGVYEDFLKAYPEDENIPYALSKLGECYEKESLSIDRDPAYTLKVIERLTYLMNRFPGNPYEAESRERLKRMYQKLADRELYVGEFYYRTFHYNSAIIRLEYLIQKYPGAKGVDRALFYLAASYRALGDKAKSDQYMATLRVQYPNSPLTRTNSSSIRGRKTLQPAAQAPLQAKLQPVAAQGPLSLYEEPKKRNIVLSPQMAASASNDTPQQDMAGDKAPVRGQDKGPTKEQDKALSFFDKKKPVDIVSDTMEGFDKEKYVVFKGSVIAKQEDLFIFADTMEAHTSETTNEIEKAYAKGNVKIVKQDRTATCQEATFDNGKGEITLKGDVVVYQGQDKLVGDVIIYYVNDDRVVVVAEKDKKAHVTVQPKQATK